MKNIFMILLFITCCSTKQSQEYLRVFDSYNNNYDYDWHGFTRTNWINLTSEFMLYCEKNGLMIKESSALQPDPYPGCLANHLKAIDINGDEQIDIIYSGTSGGMKNEVKFFIRDGNSFNNIFTIEQGIVKIEWENNHISKVFTHDWGCCGNFELISTVYSFNYENNNLPVIKKIYQSIESELMIKPLEYLPKPIDFKIISEDTKIRLSPMVDDTSYIAENIGNVIGVLGKETNGKAYASSKDKYGRIWWYVLLNPNQDIKKNILYMKELDFPTHIIGWIDSSDLTKL